VTSTYVTAGGVLIGLLAVASVMVPWYHRHGRKRDFMPLGPFIWTMILGILATLATGGWMGQSARALALSSNTVGTQLLATLAGASSPGATRRGIAMLTPGGAVLLVVLLIGCVIWLIRHSWGVRFKMFAGLIAGVTLGPTAGLAGVVGVVIAPLFNTGGNWIVGIH
jgi:peptidoglycan biosynthesis protein MviN/MurJ (putative lipid II flippase)